MMKNLRLFKRMIACVVLGLLCVTMTVHADMGPKPSIQITFEGMGPEKCYGTLLSKNISTGPSTAWDGTEADAKHNENELYSYKNLDYDKKELTFGSFIMGESKTKYAALEAMIIMMEISFKYLKMEKVLLDVRKENEHAKNFYKRFG